MKNASVFAITISFLMACTATAQEIPLTPELKPYEPFLGKWTGELETRESPIGDWVKGPWTWDVRSGGFFVEFRVTSELGGRETSGIEILGYGPIKRTFVSTSFRSDGSRGVATSEGWNGTTLGVNWTNFTADREVEVRRATWDFSPDFKSVTLTGEQFTDGKWWVSDKANNVKVD
jgi:hypothetical protein